jgi:probable HAF family extracellular repeat protein
MKASSSLVGMIALCLAGPGAVSVYSAPHPYTFSSIDVPAELGAFASAYGINNAGVLAGNFLTVDGNLDGFLVQKSQFTDVIVPGVSSDDRGALNDVNDRGQSVGAFTDAEAGITHAFVRSKGGEFTLLPDAAPDAVLTEATGINNEGEIVGFYLDAGFVAHGFILRRGVVSIYNYPGALRTVLTRINEHGQISGNRLDPDGRRRGFVLQNGVTTTIEVPGAVNSRTGGINNRGDVVGYYDDADLITHGFLLKDGVYTTLDFPGASDTALLDINDRGVIAGTYDGFSQGLVATPGK